MSDPIEDLVQKQRQRTDPTKSVKENAKRMANDRELKELGLNFLVKSKKYYYDYNFSWLGRPIIQFPQDIMAMQEIIWECKPDLIIETGIAHGGSLVFYASLLELIGGNGKVLGIDIDIRVHNRKAIESHSMVKRIIMLEGSSTSEEILNQVKKISKGYKKILVCLDSYHTHDHVLKELQLYSQFVTKGCYLVVFDTIAEDFPDGHLENRPWKKGSNPKTAVFEFLKTTNRFKIDKDIENKLLITVNPDGFLKCIKNH
ncbi:MAG: cephalosporin hydroxylase family protein [Candidatus Hodarchaeales archaeon]|jgi:cephalosporin hydroxylase